MGVGVGVIVGVGTGVWVGVGEAVCSAQSLGAGAGLDQREGTTACAVLDHAGEGCGGIVPSRRQGGAGCVGVFHRAGPGQRADGVAEAIKLEEGT